MAKFQIIAVSGLQIIGHGEGHAEAGDILGTIETDCDLGSLLSCLNYGGAKAEPIGGKKAKKAAPAVADDESDDDEPSDDAAADAAAASAGTETPAPARTTRRRK